MKTVSAKERILKKIRQALSTSVPVPFPQSEGTDSVFTPLQQEPEIEFAENFTKLQGQFAYCLNENDLSKQIQQLIANRQWKKIFCSDTACRKIFSDNAAAIPYSSDLKTCDASITFCEALVARTGSMVLSSALPDGRTASVYAPVHICIAYTHQLVYDVKDALQLVKEKYSNAIPSFITFATGPSRTADIEKTLVTGVHGPKEVFCFLAEG